MSLRRVTSVCLAAALAAAAPAAAWAGPAAPAPSSAPAAPADGPAPERGTAAAAAPGPGAESSSERSESQAAAAAVLELPALAVEIEVRDGEGRRVARVGPSAGPVTLHLASGAYVLVGPGGAEVAWNTGAPAPDLPAAWRAPTPRPPPPAVVPAAEAPPPPEATEAEVEVEVRARADRLKNGFVDALLSALVPGLGQIRNGQPGKGVGILLSTAGLLTGTILLWPRPDPHEGTGGRRDDTRSAAEEVARLAGFAVASGGFGMLYAGQILDAWQGAQGEPPRPDRDFFLRIETSGMYTIATQPGQPSHRLLQDFNVSFMFEPGRRFTLGFSDIGGGRDRVTGLGHAPALEMGGGIGVHF